MEQMAYGGQVLVTFETIANASQQVNQTYNNINTKLNDLHQILAPIVADWTGSAAEAYQVKQRQWDQAQQDMNAVLQQIGAVLEAAHDAYSQTERRNAQAWQE
jgi:6 kDa early secretory antigenic target